MMQIGNDIRGYLFYKLHNYNKNVLCFFSSLIVIVICFFKGVSLHGAIKCWRLPVFYRYPGSSIIVGNNCGFRSDFSSNLIGVNRRCLISTHSQNAKIIIGNNCGFSGTSLSAYEQVIIEDDVLVGANCLITDFDWHSLDPDKRSTGRLLSKPVIIHKNAWIGANVIILKGVDIGRNTIIGAGSVVSKSIPENAIAAGNPCKVLKMF